MNKYLKRLWKRLRRALRGIGGIKLNNRAKIAIFAVLLALLFGGGNYVYARYFSESAKWGVAIASGVYFTANYAVEVEDAEEDEVFFESVVNYAYSGQGYAFTFEVRNYENNLLFNESGVVLPYTVTLWLGEPSEDASYYVEYQDGEKQQLSTDKLVIDGQSIAGGSAFANKYTISINTSDTSKKPLPIYVEVETGEGALVQKTLRGKMVFQKTTDAQSYIESQEFVVPEDISDDAEKFKRIQQMSMLTYEIRTVSDVVSDEVTEKLKLSWDSTVLDIDLFDEVFLAWQKNEDKANGDADAPTGPYSAGDGWYYITIDVMPYSAQTINFFRGSNFSSIADMDALHRAIKAEKYQAVSEDTE